MLVFLNFPFRLTLFDQAGNFALLSISLQFDDVFWHFFQADLLGDHRRHIHAVSHRINYSGESPMAGVTLGANNIGSAYL